MACNRNEAQCSTLSVEESKKSLAGKKTKKMVFKSMLMPPLPIPLNRLQQGSDDLDEVLTRELTTISNDKSSRVCLALGANAVSKQLGKDQLVALILAADISPPSLIAHVITKAIAGKVPLLKVNKLREITKQSLGFECIAIGFKKECKIFDESVCKIVNQYVKLQEMTESKDVLNCEELRTIPLAFQKRIFKYEIRDPCKAGRSFVPELQNGSNLSESSTLNFITIDDQGSEFDIVDLTGSESRGISFNVLKNTSPKKKRKMTGFMPAKTIKVQTNRKKICKPQM